MTDAILGKPNRKLRKTAGCGASLESYQMRISAVMQEHAVQSKHHIWEAYALP